MPTTDYAQVHALAHAAGMTAGQAHVPTPMIVQQHAHPLDDNSPIVQQWRVPAGVCGFAWVHVPGNSGFGRWAAKEGLAHNDYPSGKAIWVSGFGQSMECKEAYAAAYSRVLVERIPALAGKAYPASRMD